MKINPDDFYSAMQVQRLAGLKSRQKVVQYIKEGTLNAITVEGGEGGGKRYAIKGEWVKSFLYRLEKGLIKGEKYTIPELKLVLNGAIDYCIQHEIVTLKDLIISVRRLK